MSKKANIVYYGLMCFGVFYYFLGLSQMIFNLYVLDRYPMNTIRISTMWMSEDLLVLTYNYLLACIIFCAVGGVFVLGYMVYSLFFAEKMKSNTRNKSITVIVEIVANVVMLAVIILLFIFLPKFATISNVKPNTISNEEYVFVSEAQALLMTSLFSSILIFVLNVSKFMIELLVKNNKTEATELAK